MKINNYLSHLCYLLRKVWMSASALQLVEGIQIVPRQTRCHDRQGTTTSQKPVDQEKQINHTICHETYNCNKS